jgi:small subunit ribosomal protein S4
MGRNLSPKCKQCRRIGEKLFLKGERCITPKCAIVKRNYPPGVHGIKAGHKRLSDYGTQLQEKQKAKKEYNLMEHQFRLTFDKAKKKEGNTAENLLQLLETRLDNAVYRFGFCSSRSQARELVSHGHFLINGKKVNIPSYALKTGDIIKLKPKSKNSKQFRDLSDKLKKINIPGWLNLDIKELSGKILHAPKAADIKTSFSPQAIIEFYSR